MAEAPAKHELKLPDMLKLTQTMAEVFQRGSVLLSKIAEDSKNEIEVQLFPMEEVSRTLTAVYDYYRKDSNAMMLAQADLWQRLTLLWQASWARAAGAHYQSMVTPAKTDKRFKGPEWQENTTLDFLKQAYLISSQWALQCVDKSGVDAHTKQKAKFYVEQILNMLSPSNWPFANPEVIKQTLSENGANFLRGLERLEADFANPEGRWRITQTDRNAFVLGRDIATTPGKVVFRNDVFELIHYAPVTETVFATPLLIAPPWINKFYILDLNRQKSFVKYCVEAGISVFMMSWTNVPEMMQGKTYDDYIAQGIVTAIDAVQTATGAEKVNTLGFCVGGTALAVALGYLAAKGDTRVSSATLLTTQVDFERAGDLLVYVDDEQVKWIEERMAGKGYLPGSRMADAFNLLRSNDLIWSSVINNYFLGRDPPPFDLLYWNSDSTRMPAGVHSFYLREFYLNNRLSHGNLSVLGTPIDLAAVKVPVFNLASRDDHIAPLPSVFRLSDFFGGPVELVVSGSGHVAGVVNPPAAGKYQYWTNPSDAASLEQWLAGATVHPGSWWPHWLTWISGKSGAKVAAYQPGQGGLPALCDAPGEYVRLKGD